MVSKEEMETSSRLTDENKQTKPTIPAKRKVKGIKNTEMINNHPCLISYFGRR